MHRLLLITFPKELAETSADAREHVKDTLETEGFTSEGYFSKGPADWFVIGGRWSGLLNDPVLERLAPFKSENDQVSGTDDDAQIIDEDIYKQLIKPDITNLSEDDLLDIDDWECVTDKESLVGNRWIVVVDYHH